MIRLAILLVISTCSYLARGQYFAASLKRDAAERNHSFTFTVPEERSKKFSLGSSARGRSIDAWFFAGSSKELVLIIAGVHGSELPAIELSNAVVQHLQKNDPVLFYNVLILPTLFPDNAAMATSSAWQTRNMNNTGRYTNPSTADPNRQMPTPGRPFLPAHPYDHLGRKIEPENQLLLQLVQATRPVYILNLHAIRNPAFSGVFADPRTGCDGTALGFDQDSTLAITLAKEIASLGGRVYGNALDESPTALYYNDRLAVPAGECQERNYRGSSLNDRRGEGVSLGIWASTAICDTAFARDAIGIFTIEFPGSKRTADARNPQERKMIQGQLQAYAAGIVCFLRKR